MDGRFARFDSGWAMTDDLTLSALGHLVTVIRADRKLPTWDRRGIDQVLASLRHLDAHELATRAIGHAADPEARTPGALRRPFLPTPAAPRPAGPPPKREQCADCGIWKHRCKCPGGPAEWRPPRRNPMDPGLRAVTRAAIAAAKHPDPGTSPGSSHSKEEA